MFDKVIWATDGSEFADEAMPFAEASRRRRGA